MKTLQRAGAWQVGATIPSAQICNLILLSDIFLASRDAKERLEKAMKVTNISPKNSNRNWTDKWEG